MTYRHPLTEITDADYAIVSSLLRQDAEELTTTGLPNLERLGSMVGGLDRDQTMMMLKEAISIVHAVAGVPFDDENHLMDDTDPRLSFGMQNYLYGFLTAARLVDHVERQEFFRTQRDTAGHFLQIQSDTPDDPSRRSARVICREEPEADCREGRDYDDQSCYLVENLDKTSRLTLVESLSTAEWSKNDLPIEIHQTREGNYECWRCTHR